MPGSYLIDPASGVVFVRAWGRLTDAQVTTLGNAISADPAYRAHASRLEDLREVTDLAVTMSEVGWLVDRHLALQPVRRAYVVRADFAYGTARMLGLRTGAGPDTFLVCRDLGTALEWLGLDPAMGWP